MSEGHPIKTGIIATVVGGVILAFILQVAGFASGVWLYIRQVPPRLWNLLTWDVTVPIWLLALLAVPALVLLSFVGFILWAGRGESRGERLALPEPNPDGFQMEILKRLAAADGASLEVDDFAAPLHTSRLRVGEALERLETQAIVARDNNIYGTRWGLTRRGRDFLIGKGIV